MTLNTEPAKEVRFACISDIHLGSKRNKTSFITANLNKYFVTDEVLSSIDILFIAGDVFDELLNTSSEELGQIDLWIGRLLRKCHRYHVMVFVLEGTPSHDRGQSCRFVTINELNHKSGSRGVQLKYIKDLHIEYIEKFDLHVLFVPDEQSNSPADTLDQVKALMRKMGLCQVDMAVMHGQFPHQLPAGISHVQFHDPDAYCDLVRGVILVGHIHTPSVYRNIYGQGSFDRLGHNEEEAKGFLKGVQTKDSYHLTFVENKGARIYKTISCTADSTAENLLIIDAAIQGCPIESNLRVEASTGNPILSNMPLVRERWPGFVWSSVERGKEKKRLTQLIDHKTIYVPISLDRQNLSGVMHARLQEKGYEPAIIDRCIQQLATVMG